LDTVGLHRADAWAVDIEELFMTKDEALALALEALEGMDILFSPLSRDCTQYNAIDRAREAITAIQQARSAPVQGNSGLTNRYTASPVQEPVAWMTQARNFVHVMEFTEAEAKLYGWVPVYTAPPAQPAPVQEPVAFFDPQGKGFYWAKPTQITAPVTVDVEPLPLYTTPPAAQRPFVGLTDEMVTAAARALNKRQAEACGVDKNDHWKFYGDDIKEDARAALEAAHNIKEKNNG
jgi:hypothetical protein